ncbi:WXG100 family type VII secretion target [Streptomyces sp. B6B3]|uniref:WXG100 family type VII secretion target n=1 Tax=Streptomyces sp. B6B3 TaxID=3153570 RepID=UPI00325E7D34
MDRGADIQRLRDLATSFGEKATTLRTEIIEALSTASEDSESYWKGPDSDRFRQEFRDAKPTFTSFADALDDAKTGANNSADRIEQATS